MHIVTLSILGAASVAAPQTSQPLPSAAPVAAVAQPAAPTAKIIMYRGSGLVGAAVGCPIRYKEQEIVELGRGKYAEWDVPPGRYVLTNHGSSVEVRVDAGETEYVRCILKTGFFVGHADLQIVDEESFNEHRSEFTRKPVATVRLVAAR